MGRKRRRAFQGKALTKIQRGEWIQTVGEYREGQVLPPYQLCDLGQVPHQYKEDYNTTYQDR